MAACFYVINLTTNTTMETTDYISAETTAITVLDASYNMFRDNPVASTAIMFLCAIVALVLKTRGKPRRPSKP
jgi:hypothetical protein